jgi:hypothetical protein
MAQTVTTITNAANLGGNTTITVGSPTKTVLQGATQWVILNVQISQWTEEAAANLGSSVPRPSIRVGYAISPFTLTADATLPQTLASCAKYLDIRMLPNILNGHVVSTADILSGFDINNPGVLANNGGATGGLYTWFESPPLSVINNTPPTITITSVEF